MQTLFDLIQCLSVLTASIVAIYGISSWRREATWKRKYELAEEVLSLFYQCRENIQIIRSPASSTSEGQTRKRDEAETASESQRLDNAYVFIERYEKEKQSFAKLFSLKFRFIIIFGKEAGEPFDEIRRVLNTIFFAASMLGNRYWKDQGSRFTEEQFQKHLTGLNANEEIIWSSYDENDKIAKRVDHCVSRMETICESIFKRQG